MNNTGTILRQPPCSITSFSYRTETVIFVERQKVTTGEAQNLRSSYMFALRNRLPSRLASVRWVVVALSNAAAALKDASVLEAVKEARRRTRQAKVLSFEAAVGYYLMVVAEPVRFAKVRLCWMGD